MTRRKVIRPAATATNATSTRGARGARTMAAVDPAFRRELEAGRAEARSLVEFLVLDMRVLMAAVAPEVAAGERDRLEAPGPDGKRPGVTRRMALAGAMLHDRFGPDAFDRYAGHRSDTVRGWAAYALARQGGPLTRLYERIRPLADDANAGVREWAWIALRPAVLADLEAALALGAAWVGDQRPNLRRFAVEITRPRGVWCAHCEPLKRDPARGLVLLEPMRNEAERYPQDSVANWLNDAAKDRPDFVREVCARWSRDATPAAARLVRRALRSVD